MPSPVMYESYPFIAPEKYQGKLDGKVVSHPLPEHHFYPSILHNNQVAVTGASAGIGIGISKAFAAAGTSVACIARRAENLKKVVDEITAEGHKAVAVVGDVSKKGGAKDIVSRIEKELGPIDVLVNNAGISRIGTVEDEDEDLDFWWRVYEVNVRAPVTLIRAVLPSMKQRKTGVLLTISSAVATMNLPAMTPYASSKAAISKFHELLEHELKGTGIVSFALDPGMIESELGQADGAINHGSMEHPVTKAFISAVVGGNMKRQKLELPSNTSVALAADERYRKLSGKHLSACEDLEPILKEAEKDDMGRIGSESLYVVRISSL